MGTWGRAAGCCSFALSAPMDAANRMNELTNARNFTAKVFAWVLPKSSRQIVA